MLRSELGEGEPTAAVELDQVALPEARPLPQALAAAVDDGSVLTAHEDRVRRSAGKGYPDLVRLRTGALEHAPDAVVLPASAEQVAALLEVCSRGASPWFRSAAARASSVASSRAAGAASSVIALDLRRLREVAVDPVSMTATLGPGLRGPEAEAAVRAQGFTLGHFPQSFEYATIGGFAATRSAGQASAGYGRFDELVTALAMVTPIGELRTLASPHTAAGPALRELALGSEGVLGAITEVTVRVRPAPAERRYEAWIVARLRLRARAGALARPGRCAARRHPALRRGRDAGLARARGHGGRPASAARRLPAPAPPLAAAAW